MQHQRLKQQQQALMQQALLQQQSLYHSGILAPPQIEPIPSGNLPPGFDPSTCCSVYVGNIHTQVTEPLLQEVFASTGPVESCKLVRKEKQSSYGFIHYFDRRSAALAILSLNGRHSFGQPIKVNWAYASGQREDTSVLRLPMRCCSPAFLSIPVSQPSFGWAPELGFDLKNGLGVATDHFKTNLGGSDTILPDLRCTRNVSGSGVGYGQGRISTLEPPFRSLDALHRAISGHRLVAHSDAPPPFWPSPRAVGKNPIPPKCFSQARQPNPEHRSCKNKPPNGVDLGFKPSIFTFH
ncbi:nucleolysin TIA-1 isoform p40-like isoform X2 [Hibiscus syriacus]|uniref:Nucleolysin TIA-1 isoform p40-like isoform X2 n=1 Tax=Hibiscus syriacus TaxID=106335 RepID=A0A6A2Z6G5_HIBSY|nr:nucleolysin TIA-1 isoform p40-like isoform X2 [Hibiscus syriacus]